MGAFRTVIGCNFEQYETGNTNPTRYLVLDTQEEKSITANSVIASQPLQSGDTMSDHMYRNPVEFSISGHFSLNGKNWNDESYNFFQKGDRLTNVQEVFEYIKNNGILCQLTTIDEDDVINSAETGTLNLRSNAKSRFKIRNNMALTNITWVEKQNTVHYTFKFIEVIMVEQQEYEELSEEERRDLGLPYVTSPMGSTLGTVLADTGQLEQTILRTLYDNGYVENDFLRVLCSDIPAFVESAKIAAAIIGVGLAVSVITTIPAAIAVAGAIATGGSVLGALAGSVSAIFPVGTIVVAAVAVLAGIAIGIKKLIEYKKKQEKQKKAFKLIKGDPTHHTERLLNLFDDIEIAVNKVKTNLLIYNINENKRQTVTLNLGGEYYLIEFDQNNAIAGESWGAKVTDMSGVALETVRHTWCPVSNFCALDRNNNLWFKDRSKQYEVYLVNPSLTEDINPKSEGMTNARNDLTSYSIWVSKGDIKKEIKKVENAIEKAIEARGFGD